MRKLRKLTSLGLLSTGMFVVTPTTQAVDIDLGLGLFKRKQQKPDPTSRAAQLTVTLQTDPDEAKRKAAATEMRGFDPRQYPEIIPALTRALQKDPSPAVRIEAVEVLSKMKPISQPAGLAMEAATTTEPDAKVREAIKAALWQYTLNGYRTPPGGAALATQTSEPKVADKNPANTSTSAKPAAKPAEVGFQPIRNLVGRPPSTVSSSPEPPLAATKIPPVAVPTTPPAPKPAPPTTGVPLPMIPEVKPVVTPLPAPMPIPTTTPPQPTPTSSLPLPAIPVPPLPFPATTPPPSTNGPLVPTLPPLPDKPF